MIFADKTILVTGGTGSMGKTVVHGGFRGRGALMRHLGLLKRYAKGSGLPADSQFYK